METKSNKRIPVINAFDLVKYVWDKKWILIGLSSVAFIAAIIVTLNITPRFKSDVVLYPAASISLSKSLVETSSISTDNRDALSFGEDEEAERMLQILHSNQIKDHIVNKFNLMGHYDIDPNEAFPYTKLDNKYKGNIKFRRTEFMSIVIEVLDTDPQMAADIANEIAAFVDSVVYRMQRQRAMEAFNIVEKEYLSSQLEIDQISDSLQKIRQSGAFDLNAMSKYGGIYLELSKKLESEIERMSQLKTKYSSAKVNLEQAIPQIFIVDKAVKAERKAVPKRSIIVVITTLSTFALSLLVLLILDQIKAGS